jgi:hypothetical protein
MHICGVALVNKYLHVQFCHIVFSDGERVGWQVFRVFDIHILPTCIVK